MVISKFNLRMSPRFQMLKPKFYKSHIFRYDFLLLGKSTIKYTPMKKYTDLESLIGTLIVLWESRLGFPGLYRLWSVQEILSCYNIICIHLRTSNVHHLHKVKFIRRLMKRILRAWKTTPLTYPDIRYLRNCGDKRAVVTLFNPYTQNVIDLVIMSRNSCHPPSATDRRRLRNGLEFTRQEERETRQNLYVVSNIGR